MSEENDRMLTLQMEVDRQTPVEPVHYVPDYTATDGLAGALNRMRAEAQANASRITEQVTGE